MNKPVLQTEVLNERQQTSRMVVLFVCLASVAWLLVAAAQGVVFCTTFFLGMRGK